MKLKMLCCNKTVLGKDISRFAPLWGVYLAGGLLIMLTMLSGSDGMHAARDLGYTLSFFSIFNMIYAALCALTLFGDLFQSRMCNALHALPLRRESWFLTHVVAGLIFSAGPHLIAAVLTSVILQEAWYFAWIWVGGMTLEFLFFFGLAVFSAFCAGNRVGTLTVYAMLNFGAAILRWFLDTIYMPLLYGVKASAEILDWLYPVSQMCGFDALLVIEYPNPGRPAKLEFMGFGEGWGYLAICAGVGVVLMGLALLLYRRRKLENAGNFIAVKPLEPIFGVIFTLSVGCLFAGIGSLFNSTYLAFLVVGLLLGWFGGQMLLKRTVRIFQWRTFAKAGVLGAVLGISLIVTGLDPLGITRWVPEKDQVVIAEIDMGDRVAPGTGGYLKLEHPTQIDKLILAHEDMIRTGKPSGSNMTIRSISLRYTLTDGSQVTRYYTLGSETVAAGMITELYSTPEQILGYQNWEHYRYYAKPDFNGYVLEELYTKYIVNDLKGEEPKEEELLEAFRVELLDALRQDCQDGNLVTELFGEKWNKDGVAVNVRYEGRWTAYWITEDTVHVRAWMEKYAEILKFTE